MGLFHQSAKKRENYLLTAWITRRLAYPIAWLAYRLGICPDAVTITGGLCWVASVPLLIVAGNWLTQPALATRGWAGIGVAVCLWHAGAILDVADGSLARMQGKSSMSGAYVDFVFHLIFNPMFLVSLGVLSYLCHPHIGYLVLATLSITSNWGLAFAAKEHVLCEEIAGGNDRLADLSSDRRYRLYIDSPRTREPAADKRSSRRVLHALLAEFLCFPGQYTLLTVPLIADFGRFLATGNRSCLFLRIAFAITAGLNVLRVPFRIRREFHKLQAYEQHTSYTEDRAP